MKRGLSGWQLRSQRTIPENPDQPAGFDVLLETLGITEKEAPKHPDVRRWIRENSRTKFVPEQILKQLGVDSNWDYV